MTRMIGAVWIIQWNNPYTEPPGGLPRVLAEFYFDANDPRSRLEPEEVKNFYLKHNLFGSGYGIHWQAITPPPKTIQPEKLTNIRMKRLRLRIEKKYPLFSEQFIAEEVEKKSDYYNGITDAEIERRRASVIEGEEKRLHELLEKRVIFYLES